VTAPAAEAFRSLRRHVRLTLDHRLTCMLCRRPPQRRRCADGERLEAQRRDADRAFSFRRRHRHPFDRPRPVPGAPVQP
jgi:hypothetical protein